MVRGFVEHGSIFEKDKGFFAKNPEGICSGLRVDFRKVEGFFRKMTAARLISAADRTATKSRRRGRAGCASWPQRIISLDEQQGIQIPSSMEFRDICLNRGFPAHMP